MKHCKLGMEGIHQAIHRIESAAGRPKKRPPRSVSGLAVPKESNIRYYYYMYMKIVYYIIPPIMQYGLEMHQ